jgi:predicted secreted protein
MGQNATYIKIQFDDTDLVGELSQSINSTADIIDVSSKATALAREILPGRVSENISFESLADDASADYGWAAVYAAMTAGTIVTFTIVRVDSSNVEVPGAEIITGSGYFSSLTKDNPDNDRSTFSGTLEIDDSIIVAAVPGS